MSFKCFLEYEFTKGIEDAIRLWSSIESAFPNLSIILIISDEVLYSSNNIAMKTVIVFRAIESVRIKGIKD